MFDVTLPPCPAHAAPNNVIKTSSPLVIVGANGSGKSRLALWLERRNPGGTHRVSAQRYLSFPTDLRGTNIDKASADLMYGHETFDHTRAGSKFGHRYPVQHDATLNDYQKLVTLLFSESAQVNAEYVTRMKSPQAYAPPPLTKLDKIKVIWETVLPTRELVIGGHKIEVRQKGTATGYPAHEMSDGERVIFYLAGQCLCAWDNGIVVIDEPELHLHRALQGRLWDAVEAARPDCLFVYVTHDLDFAASRKAGTTLWIHEYTGGENWQWDVVPPGTSFPQALLLEILGSRRPILFVEGIKGGLDEQIYSSLYPALHVVSVGSCETVIHLTASARKLGQMGQLHVDAFGLVDRDGRGAASTQTLANAGVSTLDACEIENLLLMEPVIRDLCAWQNRNANTDVAALKTAVLAIFSRDALRVSTEIAGREIDRKLRGWGWKHSDGTALKASLVAYLGAVDPDAELASATSAVQNSVSGQDYTQALRIYPNKGLTAIAARTLGVTDYVDLVLRGLSSNAGTSLRATLRSLLPNIP